MIFGAFTLPSNSLFFGTAFPRLHKVHIHNVLFVTLRGDSHEHPPDVKNNWIRVYYLFDITLQVHY